MGKILCIIDGMADQGFRIDDYPNLASFPLRKVVRTVPENKPPESLTCILTLLGYQHIPEHLRGYADALGAGIAVKQHDLVLRASWVALDAGHRILGYAQAPPDFAPSEGFQYHDLGAYKGLLIWPHRADALASLTTYPPHQFLGSHLDAVMPNGIDALRRMVSNSCQSGRCLIPWGQSRPACLPPFPERAAVITATNVVRGIARMTGMKMIEVSSATGDTDTDLAAKAEAAIRAAQHYPFVLLHINGADEAAHRKCVAEKRAFLKEIDRVLLAALLSSQHSLVVVSDHATNPHTGLHEACFQEACFRILPGGTANRRYRVV